MVITTSYNANAKTILVTDTLVYAPGERELLRRILLANGEQVATFATDSNTVSYTIPTDGLWNFMVEAYDTEIEELAAASNTVKQLTTEYAFEENIKLLKRSLLGNLNLQPYLAQLKLIKAVRSNFLHGNYPKSVQLLKPLL